tara:strand:- start:76 stop:390 length:315 start_codon:yes stop_codon:yes gene_type:complete
MFPVAHSGRFEAVYITIIMITGHAGDGMGPLAAGRRGICRIYWQIRRDRGQSPGSLSPRRCFNSGEKSGLIYRYQPGITVLRGAPFGPSIAASAFSNWSFFFQP